MLSFAGGGNTFGTIEGSSGVGSSTFVFKCQGGAVRLEGATITANNPFSVTSGGITVIGNSTFFNGVTFTNGLSVSSNGITVTGGGITVIGNSTFNNNLTISGNLNIDGNTTIGNTSLDTIAFNARVDSNLHPLTTSARNFGTTSLRWNQGCFTTLNVSGAVSKGSGSFRIPHPILPNKDLVHSFIEGPRCDLIYRGKVTLIEGTASIDMDESVGMTTGTWDALTRDPQVFVTNNSGWTAVKGSISGSILTIISQDESCTDEIDWMVVAERQDDNIRETYWTDDEGRPILEPDTIVEDETTEEL